MKNFALLVVSLALAAGATANDKLFISGFGSIIGSQVVDGSGYVADYPNIGVYDDQFDIGQESKLGIQTRATISDELSATLQVMSRANNEYEAEVEWLFVNYALDDDLELQAGKLRVPVYYFSEFMDVGYAYPWIRVPADAYSLDVTSFNGLQLNHRTYMGGFNFATTLYAGRNSPRSPEDSEIMSFIFGGNVKRSFTDMLGFGFEVSTDSTIAKVTYSQANMEQTRSNSFDAADDGTTTTDINFIDVYLQQNFGSFSVMLEYNDYDPFYASYFVSGTYQMDRATFYLMHSQFTLDSEIAGVPIEEHDTNSVGLRYDYRPRVSLKFDVSMITDTGVFAVNKDANNDGDAVILSTGVDFTF